MISRFVSRFLIKCGITNFLTCYQEQDNFVALFPISLKQKDQLFHPFTAMEIKRTLIALDKYCLAFRNTLTDMCLNA